MHVSDFLWLEHQVLIDLFSGAGAWAAELLSILLKGTLVSSACEDRVLSA